MCHGIPIIVRHPIVGYPKRTIILTTNLIDNGMVRADTVLIVWVFCLTWTWKVFDRANDFPTMTQIHHVRKCTFVAAFQRVRVVGVCTKLTISAAAAI